MYVSPDALVCLHAPTSTMKIPVRAATPGQIHLLWTQGEGKKIASVYFPYLP
jgi:hypothetical protein